MTLENVFITVPGDEQPTTDAQMQALMSQVFYVENEKVVLRNCHIDGALELRIDAKNSVLRIKGLAQTTIQYIIPEALIE